MAPDERRSMRAFDTTPIVAILFLTIGLAAPLRSYSIGILSSAVVMANPSKIRAITASKSNTDEKDSLILGPAPPHGVGYIARSYVPAPEIMRNRELLRAIIDVGQEICRTKNRVHALFTKPGLRPERKVFGG